ncbi:MAG: hypothetical protein WBA07_32890 [Rivularia sp. (in: cyanobacteria)]
MINNLKPAKLVVTLTVVTPDESYSSAETFFKSLNLVEAKEVVKKIKQLLGSDADDFDDSDLDDDFVNEPELAVIFQNHSESFDL